MAAIINTCISVFKETLVNGDGSTDSIVNILTNAGMVVNVVSSVSDDPTPVTSVVLEITHNGETLTVSFKLVDAYYCKSPVVLVSNGTTTHIDASYKNPSVKVDDVVVDDEELLSITRELFNQVIKHY